jgi:hypothetical protein
MILNVNQNFDSMLIVIIIVITYKLKVVTYKAETYKLMSYTLGNMIFDLLNVDPNLASERTEKLLPRLAKSRIDSDDPSRAIP